MDFTNPITLFFSIPVAFLVFILFRQLLKSGGDSEVDSPFFKFKRTDSNSKMLADQIKELTEKYERLQAEVIYIKSRDGLKYEYRGRLNKINKRLTTDVMDQVEQAMREATKETSAAVKATDEYRLLFHVAHEIGDTVTRKGMGDFDRNGFDKVGLDANGEYSNRLHAIYLDGKTEEYILDVKELFTGSERPLTIVEDHGVIDRKVIVPMDMFESIVMQCVKDADEDIKDLYDFIITKYRAIHNEYKAG